MKDHTASSSRSYTQLIVDYEPSVIATALLAITLRRFPIDPWQDPQEDESYLHYQYYLSLLPGIAVGSFFTLTLVSNIAFGRRPNRDNNHNPLSHRIIQTMGHVMPAAIAGLTWLGSTAASMVFGDRADSTNHIATIAMTAFDHAHRAVTIADRLYDHAMDRSPRISIDGGEPVITGQMRYIERAAMHAENTITYVAELCAEGLYIAMESRVTRFTITDTNRLSTIAGIYGATDLIERELTHIINQYAYWATRYADIISPALLNTGIANLTPVIGVTPQLQETIRNHTIEIIHEAGENVEEAFHEVVEAIHHAESWSMSHIFRPIGHMFHSLCCIGRCGGNTDNVMDPSSSSS